jgi:hypothetical protein
MTKMQPGMVVHTCNSSYPEDGGRRITWPENVSHYLKNKVKRAGSMA